MPGAIIKSNLTDNESAKMATSKGVIQGYCGVAAVDAKHQIIVEAQAHGTGSEQALLLPMVDAIRHDPAANTCICPAGQTLYSNGANCTVNGRTHHKFQGSLASCGACALRTKCLRHPDKTRTRQVAFFHKNQV